MKTCPDVSEMWVYSGEPKIILRSNSPGEESLKKLAKKAAEAGLIAALVRYNHYKTKNPSAL